MAINHISTSNVTFAYSLCARHKSMDIEERIINDDQRISKSIHPWQGSGHWQWILHGDSWAYVGHQIQLHSGPSWEIALLIDFKHFLITIPSELHDISIQSIKTFQPSILDVLIYLFGCVQECIFNIISTRIKFKINSPGCLDLKFVKILTS